MARRRAKIVRPLEGQSYYERNAEERRSYQRAWYGKNRDKQLQYQKKYYLKHKKRHAKQQFGRVRGNLPLESGPRAVSHGVLQAATPEQLATIVNGITSGRLLMAGVR